MPEEPGTNPHGIRFSPSVDLIFNCIFLATCGRDPWVEFTDDDCRSSSDSSKISAEYFEQVLEELEMRAVEDSTLKVYISAWHAMNNFYIKLDNKPKPYKQRVALFVAYMIKKRYDPQTIRTYISGIKYVLRNILHLEIKDVDFTFMALIKGARYKNNKQRLRLPIKLTVE